MKGYYKNWYQHYLELEVQKEKDSKRGYYSNLASKEADTENATLERGQENKGRIPEIQSLTKTRKNKKKFSLLGALLPIATISGFIFLWYQMDAGPVRHLVGEALVFVGVREAAIDVMSYHTSLLDQHVEFAEKVAAYINGEDELSFDDLDSLYDEIRATHMRVVEISDEEHAEAIRLWSFKMSSAQQMMNDLIIDEDIDTAHAQFMIDQQELATMIRAELMIEEEDM